jgi:hypothetical protein
MNGKSIASCMEAVLTNDPTPRAGIERPDLLYQMDIDR